MAKNQNIYPNDIIFVKQNNSLNLPKDETEYLVEKRNDFDEIDKLAKLYPVKDGTIELKVTSPEYSKSYKHGDIYNLSEKNSLSYKEIEQISGTGTFLHNIYKKSKDSFSILGSRHQINEVSVAIHKLKNYKKREFTKEKTILENYTQSDFSFEEPKGNGFFSLSCGKASDSLEYVFDEEFYLEVYLDSLAFNDLTSKIYHDDFEAIIVRANLGGVKGIYAEKPTGIYTENGFITDGQAYQLLYEKSDVKNYNELPDNFDSVGSVSRENPFIVDVYYSNKKLNNFAETENKDLNKISDKEIRNEINSTKTYFKFNFFILYALILMVIFILLNQFL